MKIHIGFLFYAVNVFADPMGTGLNSSQPEGKILRGYPSGNENSQLFMASLQINRTHMCGAGMFQLGFLISTAKCVEDIRQELSIADAVMGNVNLNEGERLSILDCDSHKSLIGIIRVQVTHFLDLLADVITFPPLVENTVHISRNGPEAALCGWGPTTENEIYSNSLHCMNIEIQTWKRCYTYNSKKGYNYQIKYHCGFEGYKKQLTLEDEGNPVIKKYEKHAGKKHYIIGITAGEFEFKGGFYARFIKISYVFNIIRNMVMKLGRCENASDENIDSGFNINNMFAIFSDIDEKCVNPGVTQNSTFVSHKHGNGNVSGSVRARDDDDANGGDNSTDLPNKHRKL